MTQPSGPEIRERTVRDYRRWAERAGAPVDPVAIEKLALADCEVADKAIREQARPRAPTKPDPEREAAHAGELERQVAETGSQLIGENTRVIRRRKTAFTRKAPPGSKWSHAVARLGRITDGATPHLDLRQMLSTCESPSLAYEVYRLRAWVITRIPKRAAHLIAQRRPQDEKNPFDGMSEFDFNAALQSMVYDICDRSTGIPGLGPWWVK